MIAYTLGHRIDYDWSREVFVWLDTGETVDGHPRACVKCGERPTAEGHDHCIANLPGVRHACCGHGKERGYCVLEDGTLVYFEGGREEALQAIAEFEELGW